MGCWHMEKTGCGRLGGETYVAKLVKNELLGDPRRLGQHEPVHVDRRHERTRHDNPDASGHLNVDPERLGDHENVREEDGRVEPSRACRFGVPVDGLHGDGRNIRRMPEQLEEAPAHLLFVRGVLGEVPTRLTCVCVWGHGVSVCWGTRGVSGSNREKRSTDGSATKLQRVGVWQM